MNCPICRNGEMRPGRVTVAFDLPGGGAVVFQGVPARICENCGERWFDEATTAQLLRRAKQATPKATSVEVLQYTAA